MNIAEKVRQEMRLLPPGGVIASAELHPLSPDNKQVDKAVSRIYAKEGLNKLRNGLYFKSFDSHFLGSVPPSANRIIRSVKKQYKAKVVPSGALAAYELGFTHHAPDKKVYETDKRIAPIITENCEIIFRTVSPKKFFSANMKLLTLLKALEFLFKETEQLNHLQLQRVRRQLSIHPINRIEKALLDWPQWFRDKILTIVKPDITTYITGTSAFNIPYQGQLSDWHQLGMLAKNKYQISGINYDSAPNLKSDELFDCSDFLNTHNISLSTTLCAKPLKAIKDILYSNIILKNKYPTFLDLDQFMISIPNSDIAICVDELRLFANKQQIILLEEWKKNNGIH